MSLQKIILVTVLFLLQIQYSYSQDSFPPGIKKIKDRGKLIVAQINKPHPPFFWEEKKVHLGFDIDFAKAIADSLGVELEFNRSAETFDEVVNLVSNGDADIAISKLSITLERSKKVRFTNPYVILRKSFLLNKEMYKKVSINETEENFIKRYSYSLGVIKGSSYSEEVSSLFPLAKVYKFAHWTDIVEAISLGKVIAGYWDELEVKRIARLSPKTMKDFHYIVFDESEDKIAVAVSWRYPHLHYWLNQLIIEKKIKEQALKQLDIYPEIYNFTIKNELESNSKGDEK